MYFLKWRDTEYLVLLTTKIILLYFSPFFFFYKDKLYSGNLILNGGLIPWSIHKDKLYVSCLEENILEAGHPPRVFLALFLDQLAGVAMVFGIVNGEVCKWIT